MPIDVAMEEPWWSFVINEVDGRKHPQNIHGPALSVTNLLLVVRMEVYGLKRDKIPEGGQVSGEQTGRYYVPDNLDYEMRRG